MKKEIEQYKKRNGNASYTEKEMLMYLVERVDRIFERLEAGAVKIATNKARIDSIVKIGVIVLAVFLTIFGYFFANLK